MDNEIKLQLQNFLERLNQEPAKAELQATPDGGAVTLPISFVEMTLDEIFLGQWELSDVTYQQVFNEIVGTGVLTVWNPITNRPIRRTGFASIVITQDKGAALQDFNATKKKNALDLSFPKLKAEIVKNAAISLGKVFGRDVNRKQFDAYRPAYNSLSDAGFSTLLERVKAGKLNDVALAKSNFVLTEVQILELDSLHAEMVALLSPEKTKQLSNGSI